MYSCLCFTVIILWVKPHQFEILYVNSMLFCPDRIPEQNWIGRNVKFVCELVTFVMIRQAHMGKHCQDASIYCPFLLYVSVSIFLPITIHMWIMLDVLREKVRVWKKSFISNFQFQSQPFDWNVVIKYILFF